MILFATLCHYHFGLNHDDFNFTPNVNTKENKNNCSIDMYTRIILSLT